MWSGPKDLPASLGAFKWVPFHAVLFHSTPSHSMSIPFHSILFTHNIDLNCAGRQIGLDPGGGAGRPAPRRDRGAAAPGLGAERRGGQEAVRGLAGDTSHLPGACGGGMGAGWVCYVVHVGLTGTQAVGGKGPYE